MNNAQAIFESLQAYADVQNQIGNQEDIFLDFKERDTRWSSPEKLSDDEKRIMRRAASGCAHQQGGVLVWGVEARKGRNGVDEAKSLKPFSRVKQFKQALEDYSKYATEPIVDGVLHRAIFVSDDESGDHGFVMSYFPKSNGVHRALGGTTSDFYKRHGDSFTPLSTEEVRNLFFRTLAPDIEFIVEAGGGARAHHSGSQFACSYLYKFGLKNVGSGVARFFSLYVGLSEDKFVSGVHQYDSEGNVNFQLGRLMDASEFEVRGMHFIVIGDVVIYPGQQLMLFSTSYEMRTIDPPPAFRFKIYAENMLPKQGERARP